MPFFTNGMDPEIQELKAMVQKDIELSQETNHMVHAMRRNARLANIIRVVYWLAIIGVIAASYYFYVAPYIARLEGLYQQTQTANTQAQTYLQNIGQSIQKLLSMPLTPQVPTTVVE